jgi:ribosome maturation factor RimP
MENHKPSDIALVIEQMLSDFLQTNQFELIDVEYVKESNNWFLRIYIDKVGGIDIDDCSRVSEYLSEQLDLKDPIPQAYFLEVSSPGAERPLRKKEDFYKSLNQQVFLTTYEPISSKKEFEGILTSFDGENVQVTIGKQIIDIPYGKISQARLSVVF